jgi:hypothetical protein
LLESGGQQHRDQGHRPGWFLLELLRLQGWDVAATLAFAGGDDSDMPPSALVLARDSRGHDIRVVRQTFAEASLVVFTECMRRRSSIAGRIAA